MPPKMKPLFISLLLFLYSASASDSDPLQDFCIPMPELSSIFLSCKNSSDVTVDDFVFSGIKSPAEPVAKTGFSSIPVSATTFPGLNTLGMSFVRADFEPSGINPPHYHPRATEVAFVLEGKIYSGFVDSQNRVFAKVLEKGEVMVFPKGLLHFQMNVGDKRATIIGSFNSQNPGLVKIPSAVFGTGIKEELLEKVFGLNAKDLSKLRKKFEV
ncbi:germin-like protein subfamily 3 member 2 [Andrographis paniculata]|uniref:germin-like protein subfamily 3 member 2 n=1 Tax=Andrographis paniculata TaxID=175694 RepID=UPI0021E87A84|nr:germin-like protein subfamily 3 member 2 [Andrographis paniculata]